MQGLSYIRYRQGLPAVTGSFSFFVIVNAFDVPARQSFVVELIDDREDLGNAIALNSSLFNAARLVGPSVAGVLIAASGGAACFFLNAVSFTATVWALSAIRLPDRTDAAAPLRLWENLREGIAYTFGSLPIRSILILVALVSALGISSMVLLPVFAKDILAVGPGGLGVMQTVAGLGTITGSLVIASMGDFRGKGRLYLFGTMGFGLPAAIGAKMARPDAEVWAIVGDGGFQMTQAELATAAVRAYEASMRDMSTGQLSRVLEKAMKEDEPGSGVAAIVGAGTSDSRFLRAKGVVAYGIAPFKVNYYDADSVHGTDERIRARFFAEGVRLVRRIVTDFSTRAQ